MVIRVLLYLGYLEERWLVKSFILF